MDLRAEPKKQHKWSPHEDDLLLSVIGGTGLNDWNRVAKGMPGRTARQCKERYTNQLDPNLNRTPITPEEEKIIIRCQALYGNKWSSIAAVLPGRAPNHIKNHWYCLKRKNKLKPKGEGLTLAPMCDGGVDLKYAATEDIRRVVREGVNKVGAGNGFNNVTLKRKRKREECDFSGEPGAKRRKISFTKLDVLCRAAEKLLES